MLEAERRFRRIIGHRDLAKLVVAIERDLAHTTPVASPTEEGRSFDFVMPTQRIGHSPRKPARPRGGRRWFVSLR
jgi:hypothetical protein